MNETLPYDQNELLSALVDAWQALPREKRTSFRVIRYDGDRDSPMVLLPDSAFRASVFIGDLEALAAAGMVTLEDGSRGLRAFRLTTEAFRYYSALTDRIGGIGAEVEASVLRLLNSEHAAARLPEVRLQLGLAEAALVSQDAEAQLRNIGHYCREALQAYAAALYVEFPPERAEADPAKTVNRLSGVVAAVSDRLGKREAELLDALIGYWKAASNLVQRQVHGTRGDQPALTIEDGRRVVFHTYLLIYEFERSLHRLRSH